MIRYISILFGVGLLLLSADFIRQSKLKITGVWKVVEVQTIKNGKTVTSVYPTESQAIFVQNEYSFCWTSHHAQLHIWALPDSVKLSRFNQSIVNTGSFEINDSTLITKAVFAMHPMFSNGEARFKLNFAGDTLILTGTSVMSPDNIPNPVYANGSHFVSKLIKTKDLN